MPTLQHEISLWSQGYRRVAGLDEAGRGAWAGPVVAAAVVLPPDDPQLADHLAGVRDSKQLSPAQRSRLHEVILRRALAWGIGAVAADEIDRQGIVPATRRAMQLAVERLVLPADFLLIDFLTLPAIPLPQCGLVKGDSTVLSIAAASILAKVQRDRLMVEWDSHLPGYGFAHHKGYGSAEHRAALAALGPCAIHRLSFAPCRHAGTN